MAGVNLEQQDQFLMLDILLEAVVDRIQGVILYQYVKEELVVAVMVVLEVVLLQQGVMVQLILVVEALVDQETFHLAPGGAGGSGIVIIRYKFQ
jgi:hypothetical protein